MAFNSIFSEEDICPKNFKLGIKRWGKIHRKLLEDFNLLALGIDRRILSKNKTGKFMWQLVEKVETEDSKTIYRIKRFSVENAESEENSEDDMNEKNNNLESDYLNRNEQEELKEDNV